MDIIVYKLFLFPPRCIKLQFGGEEAQNEAWSWLAANQLSTVVNTKESRLVPRHVYLLLFFLQPPSS